MRKELLDLKAIKKGLLTALGLAGVLLGAALLVILVSETNDFYGENIINGIISLSLLYGGGVAGAKARVGGWQHGIVTGVAGGMLVLAIGQFMIPELFTWYEAVMRLSVLALAGAAGGIVGVNLPPLPRRNRHRQRYYGI